MPRFNVGDKICFIRSNSNGGDRYGRTGEVGTIIRANVTEGQFKFDNPERQAEINFAPWFSYEDVELVVIPPVRAPEAQSTTFYTLVYKTRHTTKRTMGFLTEQEFNEKKATVLQQGGTVFGEKKLKLSNV